MNVSSSVSFITVPLRLLSDQDISATAKLLYSLIDYYQRMSGGICYETNASLASTMCDCTQETISRRVRELSKAGYIVTTYIEGYGREIRILK